MTDQVPESSRRVRYIVTNPAGQTVFDIPYPISKIRDSQGAEVSPVAVYIGGLKTVAYDWSVSDRTIELDVAAPQGAVVTIDGARPIMRGNGYPPRGTLDTALLNSDMNATVEILQEMRRDTARSVRLNPQDPDTITPVFPPYQNGRAIIFQNNSFGIGPNADEIASAQGYAIVADEKATAALAAANNSLASSQEAAADAQQVAEILEGLTLGPSSPKVQIFTSGVAGATELVVTVTPYPTQEEVAEILIYGSGGNYQLSPDTYAWNAALHKFTFSPAIPAGTTKVVIRWWTSLNAGTPGDKSVNWLTKIVDQAINTIAGWGADGVSRLYSLVTSLSGASSDEQIPSAKAVYDHVRSLTGRYLQAPAQTISGAPSVVTISSPGTDYAIGPQIAITPVKASSVIRLSGHYSISATAEEFLYWTIYRDGAAIVEGDAAGSRQTVSGWLTTNDQNRPESFSFTFLDAPGDTNEHVYEVRFGCWSAATLYINRQYTDTNNSGYARAASWLIAEEVGQ